MDKTYIDFGEFFYLGYSMVPLSSNKLLLHLNLKKGITYYIDKEISVEDSYTLSNVDISIGKFTGYLNKVHFLPYGFLNKAYSIMLFRDCRAIPPRMGCPNCGTGKYFSSYGNCDSTLLNIKVIILDCQAQCAECRYTNLRCTSCKPSYYKYYGSDGCVKDPLKFYAYDNNGKKEWKRKLLYIYIYICRMLWPMQ